MLTSASGGQGTREDQAWQHGAFTKVLLDALSKSATDVDTDHDGIISMSELTAYLGKTLPILTDGKQRPGIDQRFEDDLFVTGL